MVHSNIMNFSKYICSVCNVRLPRYTNDNDVYYCDYCNTPKTGFHFKFVLEESVLNTIYNNHSKLWNGKKFYLTVKKQFTDNPTLKSLTINELKNLFRYIIEISEYEWFSPYALLKDVLHKAVHDELDSYEYEFTNIPSDYKVYTLVGYDIDLTEYYDKPLIELLNVI